MPPAKKQASSSSGECPQCGGTMGAAGEFSRASAQCVRCGYMLTDEKAEPKEKPSRKKG